jgi:hypothetical protein
VWGTGVAGPLVERRRRLERETLKQGLRVRLEKKVNAIRERRREGAGVGVLIWRFSKRLKMGGAIEKRALIDGEEFPRKEKVGGLRHFWEGLGGASSTAS